MHSFLVTIQTCPNLLCDTIFTHMSANYYRLYSFYTLFALYSTCILDIKESFGKKHESGIRKSFEKHNLLDVLQKLKSKNIPRFEAVLGVLSKDNPADLLPYEDVVAPPSKKMRTHGKEKTIQSNCK